VTLLCRGNIITRTPGFRGGGIVSLPSIKEVEMVAILSIFLLVSTAQAPVLYTSSNAEFLRSPGYVLCEKCPEPSQRKRLLSRPATPFLLLPKIVQEKKTQSPPPAPVKSSPLTVQTVTERQTVFFDFNSYVLKPAEKLKLDGLDKKSIIDVIGYTDSVGTKQYNDRLALKRASAVASYLGISAPFSGRGKCCYADTARDAHNRRVEIDSKSEGREGGK
jgi:outer membrane protein OmpA-like peptidoglycan-associated protein